jgi:predicted acyltransferase
MATPTTRPGAPAPPVPASAPAPTRERLMSLDAFRGLAIAAMIVFANPGSWTHIYWSFVHAEWHGWTPMDLPFPWFLFIVGTSVALSIGDRPAPAASHARTMLTVLRRALVLFALGLFLNAFPDRFDLATLRVPGVLQRIAVCYLLAAVIVMRTTVRAQIAITAALLAGYWLLLALVPVPGVGAGVLTREGNLTGWVDRVLLPGHIYQPHGDPEGILSTLPALATTLLGVLAAHWLRTPRSPASKARDLILAGVVLTLVGRGLHPWVPLNKNLWTSSFVLFTAGTALMLFGLCYWLVDVRGHRRLATPLVVFGRNAIAIYVVSNMVQPLIGRIGILQADGSRLPLWTHLYAHVFAAMAGPKGGSLLQAVCYTLLWLVPMGVLHRLKIWIRV